jgi:hypothetical protein
MLLLPQRPTVCYSPSKPAASALNVNQNPFAPPTTTDVMSLTPLADAKRRLARPATALIIMSSIHAVLLSIALVNMVLQFVFRGLAIEALLPLTATIFQFLLLIFISIAAAKMGFLESYKLGQIGALFACIPFVTPFTFLGIPFGIWAYVLLSKPEIKAAFEQFQIERKAASLQRL